MILSPRLRCIADMVSGVRVLADIGSDHAYLPIKLLEEARIERAIVTDVAMAPLEIARCNIKKSGYLHLCALRHGDGLHTIKVGEADCIVVAGMGGHMISKILEEGAEQARRAEYLILQPMQNRVELRDYLNKHSYTIVEERVVVENGKYYEIIKAVDGEQRLLSRLELEIGFAMRINRDYASFLNYKKSYLKNLMSAREESKIPLDNSEYQVLLDEIENIICGE